MSERHYYLAAEEPLHLMSPLCRCEPTRIEDDLDGTALWVHRQLQPDDADPEPPPLLH